MSRQSFKAALAVVIFTVAVTTAWAEITAVSRTNWFTSALVLDLASPDIIITQDLGGNPVDVVVDGITFHRDPTTCNDIVNGCEDTFNNGPFTIRLRGENFPYPEFEPEIDGPGGSEDDLEDILAGVRHRIFTHEPPPLSRALQIRVIGLQGGVTYRLQLLFVEGHFFIPGARTWDITLDDGTGQVLVLDEFDIVAIRGTPTNNRGVVATIDFSSNVSGPYTLDILNPKDYNGNGPAVDRSGTISAFILRTSLFADGFEFGDTSAWSSTVP